MYCWHFNEVRLALLVALIEFSGMIIVLATQHKGSLEGSAFWAVIAGILSWTTLRALNPKKRGAEKWTGTLSTKPLGGKMR